MVLSKMGILVDELEYEIESIIRKGKNTQYKVTCVGYTEEADDLCS